MSLATTLYGSALSVHSSVIEPSTSSAMAFASVLPLTFGTTRERTSRGLIVDQRQHRRLVGGTAQPWQLARVIAVTVGGRAANPRLIRDHGAGQQGRQWITAHGLADAMQHEPRGLGGQVVLALDLAGADAVLGGAHLEYHQQPRPDGDLGTLEDRPGQHRELLAAPSALPHAALRLLAGTGLAGDAVQRADIPGAVDQAAVRADRAAVPPQLLQQQVSVRLDGDHCGQRRDREFLLGHKTIVPGQVGFVKSHIAGYPRAQPGSSWTSRRRYRHRPHRVHCTTFPPRRPWTEVSRAHR